MTAPTMKYGDYTFSPVPMLTISHVEHKTGDQDKLGSVILYRLEGWVTPLPDGDLSLTGVMDLQDQLVSAFDRDGKLFLLQCGTDVIISGYPRINQPPVFSPSNDNWTQKTPFSLEVEMDGEPKEENKQIASFEESWSVELDPSNSHYSLDLSNVPVADQEGGYSYVVDSNPYQARLTHNLTAVGKTHYTGDGLTTGLIQQEAWETARDYLQDYLGYDEYILANSGVINLDVSTFTPYNHARITNVDEAQGACSVTETWFVLSTGAGVASNATESFNVDIQQSAETDLISVNINGQIQGVETVSFGSASGDYAITETKYESASGYWEIVKNRLFPRAQYISQGYTNRTLNPRIQNSTVGKNPVNGVITYNYSYSDEPLNCIAGAKRERIVVSNNNPVDVFASIPVLGRAAGPILQNLNTVTSKSTTVSIEAVMEIPTGCTVALLNDPPTSEVAAILCLFETDISGTYDAYYKTQDNDSWEPKTGRYSRVVTWTVDDCSFDGDTSLC